MTKVFHWLEYTQEEWVHMPPKEHSKMFTKTLFVPTNPQSHPKQALLGE